MPLIVVLSGHANSGKSTVAQLLAHQGFAVLSTRTLLAKIIGVEAPSRSALIAEGDAQDEHGAGWLTDEVASMVDSGADRICVDRARKPMQIDAFRERFGRALLHVHLIADETELKDRHARRTSGGLQDVSFEALVSSDRAYNARLAEMADVLIDTSRQNAESALHDVLSVLKRAQA